VLIPWLALGACVLGAPPAGAAQASVTIADFQYNPSTITINVGDTVRWSNNGPSTHTVSSDQAGLFDSGNIAPGSGYTSVPAQTPGTYAYHCNIHPTLMRGTIVVVPVGASGTPTITATPTTVAPGGLVTVNGQGFTPNTTVNLALGGYSLAQTPVGASGTFTKQITVPSGAPAGTYQVSATLIGGINQTANTPVTIASNGGSATPLATGAAGTTPTTGAASTATTPTSLALPSSVASGLPSSIPSFASAGGAAASRPAAGSGSIPARTGSNSALESLLALALVAAGVLLLAATPRPGRHARRARF
jgi:plastocyanin